MLVNDDGSCSSLKVIPLGGVAEIGLNMTVFQYEEAILLVDAGLMFPEDTMLGVDIVIPDFDYLRKNRERLKALVVTHGHEDHIGAVPFLLREFSIPVYGTPLTLAFVAEKLKEHGLLERASLVSVSPRQKIAIGPFQVEPIRVCHSIPDGVGLALRTPAGVVIHSGDFKIDATPVDGKCFDMARFCAYGEEGVLALLSDSTNAEREGYTLSERDVGVALREIFLESRGRIVVAVFASNIHRIQQIVDLARDFGRKVLLNGRSMLVNVRIAVELGYLNFDPEEAITFQDLKRLPDSEVLMLTTGSQGEPMSALTRMAFNDHKKLKVKPGDTVVLSSKFIPGNERNIQKIINHLYRLGAEVVYEQVRDIHASGHAYGQELKLMLSAVKPRFFIPVHGEYRHLVKHAQLAVRTGIPPERCCLAENGDVISLKPREMRVEGRVRTGRVLIDGKGVGDVGDIVLRDRKHLSENGLVIVSLVTSKEHGEILSGPDIFSRGFILEDTKPEILDDAKCVILEVFDRFLSRGLDLDPAELQVEIRRDLKRFFYGILERRPVIYPIVIDV